MDCCPPGSSVHGILQARILGWVAISSSRGSSWPRDWTQVSCISCTGRWILYHWVTWEVPYCLDFPNRQALPLKSVILKTKREQALPLKSVILKTKRELAIPFEGREQREREASESLSSSEVFVWFSQVFWREVWRQLCLPRERASSVPPGLSAQCSPRWPPADFRPDPPCGQRVDLPPSPHSGRQRLWGAEVTD